jgi:hypothetical protein
LQKKATKRLAMCKELHDFPTPRPELVIANNSGLFLALDSLKQENGTRKHPDLTCIIPDFWLDHVHSDYHGLDWGQSLSGFPLFAQALFRDIYPHQRADIYVTWKQYEEKAAKDVLCPHKHGY